MMCRAIECLPESREDFEDPHTSIYLVFGYMLSAAVNFHKTNNKERLQNFMILPSGASGKRARTFGMLRAFPFMNTWETMLRPDKR
jgi:hypothetical protein